MLVRKYITFDSIKEHRKITVVTILFVAHAQNGSSSHMDTVTDK